jgi:hypothetical protein
MSGKLRLNGATSGYSELQAPDVAGDQTFTLPAVGGELITSTNSVTTTDSRIATAWVNFSGTSLAIRDSYNVDSITRIDVGRYQVNFSTPMDNDDYCALVSSIQYNCWLDGTEATNVKVSTLNSTERADALIICVTIFGGKS